MQLWRRLAFIALALGYPVGEGASAQGTTADHKTKTEGAAKPSSTAIQDSLNRIASTMEAAENSPEAQEDRQRAKDNLTAQRNMANWALGAMLAATAEVLISAVGIFLIWRTLIHTRDAAKATQRMAFDNPVAIAAAVEANNAMREANEIAKVAATAQDRPHLLPAETNLSDLGAPDLDGNVDFTFKFINHGKGPGWIKRYAVQFRGEEEIPDGPEPMHFMVENAAVSPRGCWGTQQPMKITFSEESRARIIEGKEELVLFFALEYVGAGGTKHVHKFAQLYIPSQKRLHPIDHAFWEYT